MTRGDQTMRRTDKARAGAGAAGRARWFRQPPALLAAALLLFFGLAATAHAVDSITSPDTVGNVGQYTSLALDGNGNPVISYYSPSQGALKLLHCDDPNCAGDESANIATPDSGLNVGLHTSLVLDGNGNPVVSYTGTLGLKILHCNDAKCQGNDESITSPDSRDAGRLGQYTSLALDSNGNPVVSYYFEAGGNLKILHCDDPNCAGDESDNITSPDTTGDVGEFTSLALDGDGNPVVSYYDRTNQNLKILRCNDAKCQGNDESITSPDMAGDVGQYTSLVLDGNGNPVVSYIIRGTFDLKIMRCNDPNCDALVNGPESITSPDTAGVIVGHTSLALDGNGPGNPVVSYADNNVGLKVLHCDDPNCAAGGESIVTTGRPAVDTSLVLDLQGNPVISYHAAASGDLEVLHCDDPNCETIATVEIRKQQINGGAAVDLLIGNEVPLTVALAGAISGDTTGPFAVKAGRVFVGESFEDANSYVTTVVCHDQNGDELLNTDWVHIAGEGWFEMMLEDGDEVLCTITNVFIPEECQGQVFDEIILGTGGRDILRGTPGDDLILGFAGDDYLYANGGGRDCVAGGAGDDRLRGDSSDTLIEGSGQGVISMPGGSDNEIGDNDDGDGGSQPPSNDDDDDDRPRSRRSRR